FTYQLVAGMGDTDNAAFTIDGNQLRIYSSPDFETKSSYSIRVRTEDADGQSYSQNLTININDVNENPTDLSLSNNSIDENVAANTVVGTFSTTDPDTEDTFTYQLVTGMGDTDNAAFTIVGDQLRIYSSPDLETKSSYSIRVRTEDADGQSYSKNLTININDVNDPNLSNNSIDENVADLVVGTFWATDPDTEDTFTYQLVAGAGDTDNAAFTIVGDELRIKSSPDFETQSSYSIRVRTEDADGQSYSKNLTININDANLSNNSIDENVADLVVGTFGVTDPDTEDTFTYQLVAGAGDTDNFTRVRTEDAGGLSYSENFTININDVNEALAPMNRMAQSPALDAGWADLLGEFHH
ncbi:MAG: cadherin repeat domain-containing protein, partial [Hormoscilla sp. GUM202]|nr:cadherin repeat domain-containing protein [Hormoscilla sp. GUM202]